MGNSISVFAGGKRRRFQYLVPVFTVLALILAVVPSAPGEAQVAVGLDLAPPIAPLSAVAVPDVNMLGLLDGSGPNANAWPQITNAGNQEALQQLGKAFFWDMQLGGDGIQGCASCHFHAGADNRDTNQMSPGFTLYDTADNVHDWVLPNEKLDAADFPFPTNEAGLMGLAIPNLEDEPNGYVWPAEKLTDGSDVNDAASSQGPRLGTFDSISDPTVAPLFGRVDTATLADNDPDGFNNPGTTPFTLTPDTVRHVEPLNSPTVINAVYQLRNFWDGRADLFFNGRNPLGFRDPDATVPTWVGDALVQETLRVPFSSLASQAVGPPLSFREMHWDDRNFADLGKKMMAAKPLRGQQVLSTDSLLGTFADTATNDYGLTFSYDAIIRDIFVDRFTAGTTQDVCLDAEGVALGATTAGNCATAYPEFAYTLLEWNFPTFFGLAVQAYEATLFTEETIVDLINGGVATGVVSNGLPGRRLRTVNVGSPGPNPATGAPLPGLSLDACIAALTNGVRAADRAAGVNACYGHYAKFIHPGATTGTEMLTASAGALDANMLIGGCMTPETCLGSPNAANARIAIDVIARGQNRFFAGATACGVCHFNPETTGQTVSALTGFGAAPLPPLPPGQLLKIPPEVVMERMVAFDGAPAVYDSGFYNLGLRPSPEHLSIGDQIDGVPLSFAKLSEIINGAVIPTGGPLGTEAQTSGSPKDVGLDQGQIDLIAAALELDPATATAEAPLGLNDLWLPFSPLNLAPRPFQLELACAPGLVGNGNGRGGPNNNPIPGCVNTVIVGERLLRNGAFHASGLRNIKFTGPYFHNGSKKNLAELVQFYDSIKHFETLNFHNLDAGLRVFNLGAQDEAALIEFMETGLTDWRVAFEEGKFDHPQLCVPNGHDPVTGQTVLVDIPAVGSAGALDRLLTFEEVLNGVTGAHGMAAPCQMTSISTGGFSTIDVPPAPIP